jgi:1,2-beta-oligoglucan phosphorylase
MRAEINANGSVRRLDHGPISLALFPGNELEGGPANLYLRRHGAALEWLALLGPASPTRFDASPKSGALHGEGSWGAIHYRLALVLAADAAAWFWHLQLENHGAQTQTLDLTYAQDLALAPYGAVRMNEYYVSQYVDHTALAHPARGLVLCSRQNQAADGRNPWSLIGSLREGVAYATDALQLHGLASRAGRAVAGLAGDLPGRRLQHEHSMVVVRDAPLRLAPGATTAAGFFGCSEPDHPQASAPADLERVSRLLGLPEAAAPAWSQAAPPATPADPRTLFSSAPLLQVRDLDAAVLRELFAPPWRHEERAPDGTLQSFFYGPDSHVVLRGKELEVLRPHGVILRTGRHLTPDEMGLTSTAWMAGAFHSMVTQGHVSINRLLSTVHSYLGLFRSQGQRVFVELGGVWQLLDVPSAFEMTPQGCRWIYLHDAGLIEVRAEAGADQHELTLAIEVRRGGAARFLLSHHVAINGDDGATPGPVRWRAEGAALVVSIVPGSELAGLFPRGNFCLSTKPGTVLERIGGDEVLFLDGRSRAQPFLCVVTAAATRVALALRAALIGAESQPPPLLLQEEESLLPQLKVDGGPARAAPLARLADIALWYAHDALVHYLSPRGLEQYSGGGWGTRDVCQGPVELLLALGRPQAVRDLLLRVIGNQNPDGDWPQWFMFFERERNIRAGDSHGDIVFWPLLVLGQYLLVSGDADVLAERVPYFSATNTGAPVSVWEHAERALELIERRVVPGTSLAAYGHGDWNDSLQPVNPAMREHMCSAWTVTLHFQTLTVLARALRRIGRVADAQRLEHAAAAVHADFQRLLVVDGVLAGYAVFEPGGGVRYLLHPRDTTTGIRYSALAMIHAVLEDMLTPQQLREHLQLLAGALSGPDGVRLFDHPMPYHGGPQRLFQRAETATFFGREIGLMYTHAHLRYAQALAHVGAAEPFLHALLQANPIGVRALIESARLRQANCYFSSSDAAFADRYEASAQYERIARGTIALEGGWRVYSSGSGIALGLIIRRLLGLDCEAGHLRIDPVMPHSLDGLRIQTRLLGQPFEVHYRVGPRGCGTTALILNDAALGFEREANAHRPGAALVALPEVRAALGAHNLLRIEIG